MKKIILCLLFLSSILQHTFAQEAVIIKGKVTDGQTKEALTGATITIPDLKINALTDLNGEFTFSHVPNRGKFLIQVSYIGYKYQNRTVDFSTTEKLVFILQPSLIEANEVVVTGTVTGADSKKNSTSVGVLTHDDMINRPSTNLIDAISKVGGVSQITTGQAISKPVIRGLSYNLSSITKTV